MGMMLNEMSDKKDKRIWFHLDVKSKNNTSEQQKKTKQKS